MMELEWEFADLPKKELTGKIKQLL